MMNPITKTMLVLVACAWFGPFASAADNPQQSTSNQEEQTSADEENLQEQINRGARAWGWHCNRCHNLMPPSERSDQVWEMSVTHMRILGNIPGDMAEDIKTFMQESN